MFSLISDLCLLHDVGGIVILSIILRVLANSVKIFDLMSDL